MASNKVCKDYMVSQALWGSTCGVLELIMIIYIMLDRSKGH
jgi:hypothetical protein